MSGIAPKQPNTPPMKPMGNGTSTDYSKGLSVGKTQTINVPKPSMPDSGVPKPSKSN